MKKIKADLDIRRTNAKMLGIEIGDENENQEDPIVTMLQIALTGEYQQWDLYTAYASRLLGTDRDSIVEEFKTHATEELEHIELLQRYLVSMGQNPTLQRKALPDLEKDASLKSIVQLQLQFEQDAVTLYSKMLALLPDNQALKLDIENILVKEQEHVHDLELLLKGNSALAMFRPTEPGEPTKPQAGYGCKSFLSKVEQQWCTTALKEITPDIYARWNQGKLLTQEEKNFVVQAIALKWNLKDRRALLRFLDSKKA